ncbi:MAG: translation initiation factor IF-3 [Candidatus Atribacteria bacterium]|nr:translation initiation factor IF-3 [Candidatus Atribacteria bacterium]
MEVKYRVNHQIGAREVRLISPEGNQIGIVPLKKALQMAEELGLDLVEVGPDANPPVCKIMDYGKFRYEKEKKAKLSRKKQKISELKELNIRPKIDEHDYQVKIKNALRFLNDGDRVKVIVRFRGREEAFKDRGRDLLNRIIEDLKEMSKVEQDIKSEGSSLTITLAPKK